MESILPPGPVYILNLIPYFALPSSVVYFSLTLARQHLGLVAPTWLVPVLSIFARPVLFLVKSRYKRFQNKRAAATLGAVLPPHVPESAFSVISKAMESQNNGFPGEVQLIWSEEYGNMYTVDLLTSSSLLTTEPDHIKAILATQFDSFDKGPVFCDEMNSLLGNGVFNADGEMWKFHRSMTRPFFTRERISDFDIYDRNCERSLDSVYQRISEGYPIEFQDLVGRFTLDSATEFLLGHNVGSLLAGIPYPPSASLKNPASFYEHPSNVFVSAFTQGQLNTSKRLPTGAEWPLTEFWRDEVKPFRKVMDLFTEPLMNEALKKRERERKEESAVDVEEMTLLAYLVKHTQDPKILKDELINLLVAGRDTTMSLLTYSMYMLAENPEVERRLRQEIFEKVGPAARPNYESMRDLKYMRAFLNEVLRLYPPVPVNVRTPNQAVVLPAKNPEQKPIYIAANTNCVYFVVNMHRRTDLWGPDAHTFDPDRFLDERLHKYLTPNPFIFCPFNAGPRICLGQQFAYHEATFYLVRLLQRFTRFKLDEELNIKPPKSWAETGGWKAQEKVYTRSHLTMFAKGGLWVQMKDLNGET